MTLDKVAWEAASCLQKASFPLRACWFLGRNRSIKMSSVQNQSWNDSHKSNQIYLAKAEIKRSTSHGRLG
jgi:hypothetical protein